MTGYKKVIKLNDRKTVAVTVFKGKPWTHFRDERKHSSVSFSKQDLVDFFEHLEKIQKAVKDCQKSIKDKNKSRKQKHEFSDSDSASIGSDSDE